jgi:hypothetical protein
MVPNRLHLIPPATGGPLLASRARDEVANMQPILELLGENPLLDF